MKSVRQPYIVDGSKQALKPFYWHTLGGNGIFLLMESELRSETLPTSQYTAKELSTREPSAREPSVVGSSQGIHQEVMNAAPRGNTRLGSGVEGAPVSHDGPAPDYELPKTLIGSLGMLIGFRAGAALLMPTLMGGVLGWWMAGTLDIPGLGLTLLSFFCLIAGSIILSEYSDYRYCQRPESKYVEGGDQTAEANLISIGYFQTKFVISSGLLFLLIGLLCSLILAMTIASWPVLFFFAICALLLTIYMVPPPWHGYLAWGIGELGILAGVGVIPLVSSYYVQQGRVDSLSLLLGIPLGAFAVLVLFSRSLIRQRRDWMLRKRTFAVVLGEARSSNFLISCIVFAYASLLLTISITSLPLLLMLGLTTLPLAIGQFKRAEEVLQTTTDRHALHQLMIKAMLYTSLLLIGLLVIDKLWS